MLLRVLRWLSKCLLDELKWSLRTWFHSGFWVLITLGLIWPEPKTNGPPMLLSNHQSSSQTKATGNPKSSSCHSTRKGITYSTETPPINSTHQTNWASKNWVFSSQKICSHLPKVWQCLRPLRPNTLFSSSQGVWRPWGTKNARGIALGTAKPKYPSAHCPTNSLRKEPRCFGFETFCHLLWLKADSSDRMSISS